MSPFDLTGKVVLISGASSGIGRKCAIECSKFGANVILSGRNENRLNETLNQMCCDAGNNHIVMACDLTDYEKVGELVAQAVKDIGRIDGILHCAGISTTLPLRAVSVGKLNEYFSANVYSAYNLTREACKVGNFSRNGGSIVFFSSVMAHVGEVGKSIYAMTKGALSAGVKSLACELAKKNIHVNSISPGVVVTPINQNLPHIADPERRQKLEAKHLLGLGQTEDIANACIFLLSDASRWITGTDLCVDGGYSAM